jgi:hypothetical protein
MSLAVTLLLVKRIAICISFAMTLFLAACILLPLQAGDWLHSSKLGVEMIWQEHLILLPQLWFWSHKLAWPEVFMRSTAVRHCLVARDLLSAYYVRSRNFICWLSVVTFWLLRCAFELSGPVRYVDRVNFRGIIGFGLTGTAIVGWWQLFRDLMTWNYLFCPPKKQ